MTLAILSLLGVLAPFCIWLIKRRIARQEAPDEKHRQDYAAADKPTLKPSVALSDSLDELDRVERMRHGADRE